MKCKEVFQQGQQMTFICPKQYYCAQNHCIMCVRPKCVPASEKPATEEIIKEFSKTLPKSKAVDRGIRRFSQGL